VQLPATAFEQCFVRRIANQRVLELVGRVRRDAANVQKFRVAQNIKCLLQITFSDRVSSAQQLVSWHGLRPP